MLALALDAILVAVLMEAIGLALFHRKTGRGIATDALLGNLAAGFFLMLATRLALGGASDLMIAGCLFAALVAHLADLRIRWH